jgi:hypothetical protein
MTDTDTDNGMRTLIILDRLLSEAIRDGNKDPAYWYFERVLTAEEESAFKAYVGVYALFYDKWPVVGRWSTQPGGNRKHD